MQDASLEDYVKNIPQLTPILQCIYTVVYVHKNINVSLPKVN